MKLALSSSAAPDATLGELLEACVRKGLAGLELVHGEGHGVAAGPAGSAHGLRAAMDAAGVAPTGFRLRSAAELEDRERLPVAAGLGAPFLVPVEAGDDLVHLVRASAPWLASGTPVVAASSDVALLAEVARTCPQLGLSWDVRPGESGPGQLEELLGTAGSRLEQIRLFGGGPESSAQGGLGVGELMSRLARARFGGALVVTPSTSRYRVAWSTWLGRRSGWGCSGKAGPSEPIALAGPGGAS